MLKSPEFDIVIPVHKKDLAVLEYCIEAARKKIVGARRIITISAKRYTNNAEWFCESKFPFSMDFVRQYTGDSCGWYFQQLLKLYAPLVIPDISENVLILDSDTVFFRKTKMFDSQGRPFYNISKDKKICRKPFDIAVEEHIQKLWPIISRNNLPEQFEGISGICHSMMFNRKILEQLFTKVEDHDNSGDKFYKIFLKHANKEHSASEYQIYFNFILIFYANKVAIRKLKYKNTADLNIKKYRKRLKYSYCSFHSYLQNKRGTSIFIKFNNFFKKICNSLFAFEQWNIGIVGCPIGNFIDVPNQKIYWLKNSSLKEFRADPFGLEIEGEKFIFFEKYDRIKRKGKISLLQIEENKEVSNLNSEISINKNFSSNNSDNKLFGRNNRRFKIIDDKDILEENHHLSYPYIFSHENKNYALIESHKANELVLYEVLQNFEFKKIKIIFKDLDVVDPSIIFFENKFWLFFSSASQGDSKLYLAYSDSLYGEWKMHKNNPVKSNISSARSAGEIFMHEGSLYRPSQNCARTYGASIKINKIIKLNEEEFLEAEEIEITPNQLTKYSLGLHNISSLGKNLTLVDGKKKVFVPHKIFVYAGLKLRKFFYKIAKNSL